MKHGIDESVLIHDGGTTFINHGVEGTAHIGDDTTVSTSSGSQEI